MNNTNPLTNVLPKELVTEIEDMCCKRSVNGSTKSNEILILFELNETAKDVHDNLMKWLFRCLDTISDKVSRNDQYEWNIISQISHNDHKEEEDDTEELNRIMVAIHITDDDFLSYDEDLMTIRHTSSPSFSLSPQEIMNCLIQEPVFVKKIGVSAVSSDVMMMWWRDMISDVASKGYMRHPMWRKYWESDWESEKWGGWNDIRETSFNFGWKGYNAGFRLDRLENNIRRFL